jgi:uncharacterized integral membrane protein (TIGR00697 family)
LALVRVMPGETTWEGYAGQAAYDAILNGVITGGLVVASLVAYLFGEFSNSVILAKLKIATRGRQLWVRTIGSTLVGELVDSILFIGIATVVGVFPWSLFLSLTLTNYLFKVVIEAAMTPLTYLVVNTLKRREHEDFYDIGTNFNPFQAG